MRLFLLHRPGVIGCQGKVMEIASPHEIVISGDVELPVSHRTEERAARIFCPKLNLERMRLNVGDSVVCLTKDNYAVEMLFSGAETPNREYKLTGYEIRYSGEFDFPRNGEIPEQHIFYGQVIESGTIEKSGRVFTVHKIHIRAAGENRQKILLESGNQVRKTGETISVVTGAPLMGSSIEIYPIQAY